MKFYEQIYLSTLREGDSNDFSIHSLFATGAHFEIERSLKSEHLWGNVKDGFPIFTMNMIDKIHGVKAVVNAPLSELNHAGAFYIILLFYIFCNSELERILF